MRERYTEELSNTAGLKTFIFSPLVFLFLSRWNPALA
jgi:hypothetical protein